ncbi:glycerophosphodiester phosphodiesterase family protein [Vibrio sp.]|nr:glycerophosphodiester phosphodiesterase family protein [Vibrio sp.]
MQITGHRGMASAAPENTLISIEKAAKHGTKWIEIDVQLTQDKQVVVIHDNTVNRCSNGTGAVRNFTYHEIKLLDAGSYFHTQFANEPIPSLKETLNLCLQYNLALNIELKAYYGDNEHALCDAVTEIINTMQYPEDKLLFSSFSLSALEIMKNTLPTVRRGFCDWSWRPDMVDIIKGLDLFSVHFNYRYVKKEYTKIIHEAGAKVIVWTANDTDLLSHLKDIGVDNIITDFPDQFLLQPGTH